MHEENWPKNIKIKDQRFDIRNLYIYLCDKRYDINFSIRFVKNMFTLNAHKKVLKVFLEKNECE